MTYYFGRVGVNTSIPPEALTVQGNILLTGDVSTSSERGRGKILSSSFTHFKLLKPSDRRIKRNLRTVNSAAQLASIENIKIYDYEVRTDDKGNVSSPPLTFTSS